MCSPCGLCAYAGGFLFWGNNRYMTVFHGAWSARNAVGGMAELLQYLFSPHKKRLCLTNVDMAFDLTPAAIAATPLPLG